MNLKPLLKWVGNKHRFSEEIVSHMPMQINNYIEPFLGSGAVLARLSADPNRFYHTAIAGDILEPLIGIFNYVKEDPHTLIEYYTHNINGFIEDREDRYLEIRDRFNTAPNALDLVLLSRTCYSGVVRFRKADGYMSTPIGPHNPISPDSFADRVQIWHDLIQNVTFLNSDFKTIMRMAGQGDLIYCDPPYTHSQSILYGSQQFNIYELWEEIALCRARGAQVMVSLNGNRKSKLQDSKLHIPDDLFTRQLYINCGKSMINRLQKNGETMEDDSVHDLLLLTW